MITSDQRAARARLQKLYDCVDNAPAGTYAAAKATRAAINEAVETFMVDLKAAGLKAPGDDRAEALAGALYAYVVSDDSNMLTLATAECFGDAMNGPARDRVIAQTARERDFIAAHMAAASLTLSGL